jgi:hypothetical protein
MQWRYTNDSPVLLEDWSVLNVIHIAKGRKNMIKRDKS